MPESFNEQADLIWRHMKLILVETNMTVQNIVSLRTYLAYPAFDDHRPPTGDIAVSSESA